MVDLDNTFFPPIVSTYADTFLLDSSSSDKNICKVYFNVSNYNTINDIKNVQLSIREQDKNISALDVKKYPCEIKVTTLKKDKKGYYVEIFPSDIKGGSFIINKFYKIQIRFTNILASNLPSGIGLPPKNYNTETEKYTDAQSIAGWLNTNKNNFSEWSTVILVRGISTPLLYLNNFDSVSEKTILRTNDIIISGKINFKNENEKETLSSYEITLFNEDDEELNNSGIKYTKNQENPNEINFILNYQLRDGDDYSLRVKYKTISGYEDEKTFYFTVLEQSYEPIQATFTIEKSNEDNKLILNIIGKTDKIYNENITIRRTSSQTNFTLWEDVHTFAVKNDFLNYTWSDCTIESGVWYKYGIQKRNPLGNRGVLKILEEPQMLIFEHMVLNGNNKQLNIKFNPGIDNMQKVLFEQKVDTIGGKFPIIRRNGNTNYKQFNISGLISSLTNQETGELWYKDIINNFNSENKNSFISREETYGENLDLYNNYNKEHNINIYYDIDYEKRYREAVIDFLTNGEIKLFRSATEGNILVYLTNVTLSSERSLGRMLYSFSATAYQIDDFSIENCNKYNIQSIGEVNTLLTLVNTYIGDYKDYINSNEEFLSILNEKYRDYRYENYIARAESLSYLKINMSSQSPYPIYEDENGIQIKNTKSSNGNTFLGYIVYINNKPICIDRKGIYELKGGNIEITSLYFPVGGEVEIDYQVKITQEENTELLLVNENYYRKIGQISGIFTANDSMYEILYRKYLEKRTDFIQILTLIEELRIECEPGTIVYLKENTQADYVRYEIGSTGVLHFEDFETGLEDFFFEQDTEALIDYTYELMKGRYNIW